MANQNPFLASPFQALIDKQAEPIQLPGSDLVTDVEVPDLSVAPEQPAAQVVQPAALVPKKAKAKPTSLIPPADLMPVFSASASHFGVPENVLMAIAQQESSYDPDAVNAESGASGIVQYMDATAKSLGINRHDPNEAIPAAAMQIAERLAKGMSLEDAVKEHFAGPDRKKWGSKTAAYGKSVLEKAEAIGRELYKDLPSEASEVPAATADASPLLNFGVAPEALKRIQAQWNAATPEERVQMEAIRGPRGHIARELNKRHPTKQPAPNPLGLEVDPMTQVNDAYKNPTLDSIDPRAEARARNLVNQGMEGNTANKVARAAALAGMTLGTEPGIGQRIENSDFDFATRKKFQEDPFFSNPAVRGAVKGYEGYKRGILGLNQMAAEVLGADNLAGSLSEAGAESRATEVAMGEAGSYGQRMFEGAVSSIAQQVPALVGGAVTGSEALVLGTMFAQTFGSEYSEGRARGQNEEQAMGRAALYGTFEVVGEKLGLGDTLKGLRGAVDGATTKDVATSMARALLKEIPGEQLTTLGQFGTDKLGGGYGLNTEAGLAEYLQQAADTAVQTVMQGGIMGGVTTGAAEVGNRLMPQRQAPQQMPQERVEPSLQPEAQSMQPAAPSMQPEQVDETWSGEVMGDDGLMRRVSNEGVSDPVAPSGPLEASVAAAAAPEAGPLSSAVAQAAQLHDADPAPLPAMPEPESQAPDYTAMPVEELKAQVQQLAAQDKQATDPEQRKTIRAERKTVEKEIGARAKQAQADSKPAEEPMSMGPFDDIKTANKMMMRYAEKTSVPHEVIEKDGKFTVQPLEASDGLDTAGASGRDDGRGRSGEPADGVGLSDGAGRAGTGTVPVSGNDGTAGERGSDAASNRAIADEAADPDSAVARNPYAAYSASKPEFAESYMDKRGVDRSKYEAQQTGPVRWQIVPRAAQDIQTTTQAEEVADVSERQEVPEEAQAASGAQSTEQASAGDRAESVDAGAGTSAAPSKPKRKVNESVARRQQANAKQDEAVRKAQESLAARKAAKEQAEAEQPQQAAVEQPPAPIPKAAPKKTGGDRARERLKAENPFLSFLATHGISTEDRADTAAERGRAGNRMIPGIGPVYRKSGKRLDELAMLARDEGFLTDLDIDDSGDTGGTRKLSDMIARAVHGKEVIRQTSAEQAMPSADDQLMAEAYTLGIETDGMNADQVYDAVVNAHASRYTFAQADITELALQDADIPLDGGASSDNLTDEELDAIFGIRTTASPQGTGRQAQEGAAQAAPGRDEGTGEESESEPLLSSYSASDVVARQDAAKSTAREESAATARADRESKNEREAREVRARADSSIDDFQLGQSAEDQLSGQKGMFGEEAEGVRYSVSGDDYRDEHRAPGRDDGAPLSDLTGEGTIYPDDVYSANGPRYYGTGVKYDADAFRLAKMAKGKPDFDVMIYRAVPKDVDADINPGDWVAITRQYAVDHGESRFDGEYKILTKMVKASEIFTNGDSIQEWGYDPEEGSYSVEGDTDYSLLDLPMLADSLPVLDSFVETLASAGIIKLHANASTLPVKGRVPQGVQALTTADGKIHVVANALNHNAKGIVLHESFHAGVKGLVGTKVWNDLMQRLGALYKQGQSTNGAANAFWKAARQRVKVAQLKGAVAEGMEAEEFGAYAIEEYANAPLTVKKWVDDLIGAVKAWVLRRFGAQLGQVTPAQLSALAKVALLDVRAARMEAAYSVSSSLPSGAAPTQANAQDQARTLTPPEQGLLRRVQAQIQDGMNRVKQVQERIMDVAGVKDLGGADVYRAETNRPGRIAAQKEDARDKLIEPMMKRLAKAGYTPAQLSELLHAQHAEERNAAVASINPEFPDGGSGLTNEQAQAILKRYENEGDLLRLADEARNIARSTLDLKLAYGLITQIQYDTLAISYDSYVPLKGDGEYGPNVKRAMGHEEREEHILENIARDYEQAIVVGEKNLARQSLLQLVLQHPDDSLWTARVPPKGRYVAGTVFNISRKDGGEVEASFVDQAQVQAWLEAKGAGASQYEVNTSGGEQVVEFTKPLQDNEVMVYVKGDPVRIQLHDEKLARQLRPLKSEQMNAVLELMRKHNRYLSMIFTGYNPAFIIKNASRDAITGTINMTGNHGAATAAKTWAKYPMAWATMLKWAATKKVPDTEMGRMLTEYRAQGGKVGASYMSDLEEQGKSLQRMYDDAKGVKGYAAEGKVGKAAWIAARKAVGGAAHAVEILNQAFENALRLALFAELRAQGKKPGVAASAAKSVTVNFDRKGAMTAQMGAFYLFINPAIQGTANATITLTKGEHKYQAWALTGMMAAAGFGMAAMGMDDDKDRWLGEKWDTRTKNLRFRVGDTTINIPMSQEFAPFYAIGVAMGEVSRGESTMKAAANVLTSFLDAYYPMQGAVQPDSDNPSLDLLLAHIPTVAKAPAQIATNRNSFGSKVVPETENTKNRPDNLKMSRATKGSVYDKAAQALATGKPYENDLSKVSPETIKLLWSTYTGGLGRFVADTVGAGNLARQADVEMEVSDVPIVKDFVKPDNVNPIRSRFYDLSDEARKTVDEFNAAKKALDGDAMREITSDPVKKAHIGLAKMVKPINEVQMIYAEQAVAINADKNLNDADKRARLKKLEAEQEAIYRKAIEAFKQ